MSFAPTLSEVESAVAPIAPKTDWFAVASKIVTDHAATLIRDADLIEPIKMLHADVIIDGRGVKLIECSGADDAEPMWRPMTADDEPEEEWTAADGYADWCDTQGRMEREGV